MDQPLRRYTEVKMNRALKGYTVHITRLNFHPLGFSLEDLGNATNDSLVQLAEGRLAPVLAGVVDDDVP